MKNVLILGGTSDIGIAISRKFAREKFGVSLAGRNAAYLSRISTDVAIRENADVQLFEFDALSYGKHWNFYQALDIKPDVAVCVFGYLGDQKRGSTDWNEAEKIIDVNYKGAVSILNVVAEEFGSRGHGTIIGISSVGGDRGRQSNFLYGSAKAGFTAYLSGLRNKLFGKGVHVVTVKPGFVNTKMTEDLDLPAALTASPAQVADAVYNAYKKQSDIVYVLPTWRYVMWIIRSIPEFVFKRLRL